MIWLGHVLRMNGSRIPKLKQREEAGGRQPSLGACEGDIPVMEKSCQGLIFPREMKSLYNYNTIEQYYHILICLIKKFD